jgi:dipeptidyl aminopeptidase/acylaminoacyl peptidase
MPSKLVRFPAPIRPNRRPNRGDESPVQWAVNRVFPVALVLSAVTVLSLSPAAQTSQRTLRPVDLFNVRQVGAAAWSPDGRYAAIEIGRPSARLGGDVPTKEMALLNVRARILYTISSKAAEYVGFFNAVWSPDGQRLAFLSVDSQAVVRLWIWTLGAAAPAPVRDVDVFVGFNDPPIAWVGDARIAVVAWDIGAPKSGNLYYQILRGRNVADQWKRAVDAQKPSVTVLESGGAAGTPPPSARLLAIDLRTNSRSTLARGPIHRMSVSADRRLIRFQREEPGFPGQPVAPLFERENDVENGYATVNWGTARHVIEAKSGAEVEASSFTETPRPPPQPAPTVRPPSSDARVFSLAPAGGAALYIETTTDGSYLYLSGGAGEPIGSFAQIWHGNEWMRDIKTGRAERIDYTSTDGTSLTAWLLLPPDYKTGTKVPIVTVVYPGLMYNASRPSDFSLYFTDFEHPQLFAALGYGVLLPSMPHSKDPAQWHALEPLTAGVLPAVDAAIARGFADPDRIAIAGHSDGGFASLGLITLTTRFRSAIATAGFSDMVSLYGTFYGQYRYGDAGSPQKAQVLRMLQAEQGAMGMGGPPWAQADRYRADSPILRADKVRTPLMLVHGDLDFVPIQQAEEFFTALYRQDKRVLFVRYQGEPHSFSSRANVVDLWHRIDAWLAETMAPRK